MPVYPETDHARRATEAPDLPRISRHWVHFPVVLSVILYIYGTSPVLVCAQCSSNFYMVPKVYALSCNYLDGLGNLRFFFHFYA